MSNPGRAARKRGATEADSTTTTTFRPGQVVAVEASDFGNSDGSTRGTVKKADEFGRVVRPYDPTERHKTVSQVPITVGALCIGGGLP